MNGLLVCCGGLSAVGGCSGSVWSPKMIDCGGPSSSELGCECELCVGI